MSQSYEQFGKYLLLEKVAAGGMAEIYLARSGAANGLNKFFAIKRILPQFSNNQDFVAMFKEEAKVAINLNHSNVVSIYDFGIESGQFYLVMDYVEGRNLRQIINELKKTNKSISIDQAIFLIKETAAGLDHAHRCTDSTSGRPLNITHRDMSPQNIMVSFEGEVKVIDFGIAKTETEAEGTKAGTLKGKFSYMSPEQAEGHPIDPRTDVFALGIVLWELLANDRLFTGSNEAAILRKVRDCQVPPIRKINPTVPVELERIVMKSLAKDRNVRYQTAANFHRDLNRFLNTQYPDFSPQDFSQFVKESFKTAFQDGRDKLVNYSKIVVEETPFLKPIEAKVVHTETPEIPSKTSEKNNNFPEIPKGLTPENEVKISLDGLRTSATLPPTRPSASMGVNKVNLQPHKPNTLNKASTTPAGSGQTRVTQISQVSYKPVVHNEDNTSGVLVKAFLVVALAVGGWWGYKNYLPTSNKANSKQIATNKNSTKITQTDLASTKPPEVKISVNSNPDGAQIFINGADTGNKTPAVISLESGKSTEITIKKEGFLEYKVNRAFTEISQVTATLQGSVTTAYISITVADYNSFTKITINGKELIEKPPITKYPVVAQQETIIKAFNPITKSTAEIHVNLKPNEEKNVQLVLGHGPQHQK